MPPSHGAYANRRLLTYLIAAAGLISFLILLTSTSSSSSSPSTRQPLAYSKTPIHHVEIEDSTLQGGAIMPKLGNETLKAELGRASWKLFHTTMARFPDKPSKDEQTALFSYIHLFARLYPCGECAGHFRQILERYPPQVTSRSKAAVWACFVHNVVNESLKKPEFDCANIGDFYDCGCAEDEDEKKEKLLGGVDGTTTGSGGKTAGSSGGVRVEEGGRGQELKLEKEDQTFGG